MLARNMDFAALPEHHHYAYQAILNDERVTGERNDPMALGPLNVNSLLSNECIRL